MTGSKRKGCCPDPTVTLNENSREGPFHAANSPRSGWEHTRTGWLQWSREHQLQSTNPPSRLQRDSPNRRLSSWRLGLVPGTGRWHSPDVPPAGSRQELGLQLPLRCKTVPKCTSERSTSA